MSQDESDLDWAVIEELFHEVSQLDENARDKFWASSSHEASVREVVESLLDHDVPMLGSADNSLSRTPDPVALPAGSQTSDLRLLFNPGAIVDGVELLFPVAQTESSEVWCGQQTTNQQRVAVKFLRASDTAAIQAERFAREVEVLKRLKHPNIASLLGAGNTQFGNPYFVMEWIDGVSVTEYCDQRQLSVRERVTLVSSLCEAIDYANKFLIVHRDLKPDNVLVRDNGEIAVLDFGIAKIISSEDSSGLIQLTQRHERLLTPAYAAPEQNRGDAITTATDVHGIGLILFELLCGHHAFSDPAQPIESSLFDRVCSGVPNAPSQLAELETVPLAAGKPNVQGRKNPQLIAGYRQTTPSALRRKLKGKLDLICAASLEKDPGLRIARASELQHELKNWMENRPLSLQSSKPTVSAVMHRYPGRFAALASLAAALAVGGMAFWLSSSRLNESKAKIEQLGMELRQQASDLSASDQRAKELEAKSNALGETLGRVVGRGKGATDAAAPIVDSGNLPDALAIRSAHTLALRHDFASVKNLIARFESEPPGSLDERTLLADIYRRLGRTTKGIELLGDEVASPAERFAKMSPEQRKLTSHTLARLMLDAGWPREAGDLKDRQFPLDAPERNDPAQRDLFDVELLTAMEEFEIAEERLADLDDSDRAASWDNDQRMRRLLLKVAIAFGRGQIEEANEQIEPLPDSFHFDPLRKIQLLRCRARAEKASDVKVAYLQEAIEHLAQSKLPNHSVGVRLATDISEAVEDKNDPKKKLLWVSKAWKRIESTKEFALFDSCRILEARADAASSPGDVDSVLADADLVEPYRNVLLSKQPWAQKSYSSKLLNLALNPETYEPTPDLRQRIVFRESNHYLKSLQEVDDVQDIDVAFGNAAILECSSLIDSERTAALKSEIQSVIEKELSDPKPARIFLLAANKTINDDGLGRLVTWISHYQNYHGVSDRSQENMIVFLAEDAMAKGQPRLAEWLTSELLASFATSKNYEVQTRALKLIAQMSKREEQTQALFESTLQRLQADDEASPNDELPGIEVTSAFHLGDTNAVSLARELLKKHPDSEKLRASIWHIKESLKESGDERLKDWKAVE